MPVWTLGGKALQEKEIRIPVDLTVGILFFLFALVILFVMPQQVTISEKDVVNGRAFPTLLMVVMMICCAMLVGKELYKIVTKQPLNWKVINLQTEIKALVILAILVVTYLLCRVTDLFVVGAIFCCLGFLVYFRCKKPSYYVITVTMAVVIWAAFRFVLNVDFLEGAYYAAIYRSRPPAFFSRWKISSGSTSACLSARSLPPFPD